MPVWIIKYHDKNILLSYLIHHLCSECCDSCSVASFSHRGNYYGTNVSDCGHNNHNFPPGEGSTDKH